MLASGRDAIRFLGMFASVVLLVDCGGSHAGSFSTSAVSRAVLPGTTRSAQVVQRGAGASQIVYQLPASAGAFTSIVNGTDKAMYALSIDETTIFRIGVDGTATSSTLPGDPDNVVGGIVRGPSTTNAFWYVKEDDEANQRDAVGYYRQGQAYEYPSPVLGVQRVINGEDNAHMYVLNFQGKIGVVDLNGNAHGTYSPPTLPDGGVIAGIAGPDKAIWYIYVYGGAPNALVLRFDSLRKTFEQFPLPAGQYTGIASFDGDLFLTQLPNRLIRVNTHGAVSVLTGPDVTSLNSPVVGPDANLWAAAIGSDGDGVFVRVLKSNFAFDTLPTGVHGNGVVSPGFDDNMWFASADSATPTMVVQLLHDLIVSPTSVTIAAGAQQAISVSEVDPAGVISAKSSNPGIATISGSGTSYTVTGVKPGSAVITIVDEKANSVPVAVTVTGSSGTTHHLVMTDDTHAYVYTSSDNTSWTLAGSAALTAPSPFFEPLAAVAADGTAVVDLETVIDVFAPPYTGTPIQITRRTASRGVGFSSKGDLIFGDGAQLKALQPPYTGTPAVVGTLDGNSAYISIDGKDDAIVSTSMSTSTFAPPYTSQRLDVGGPGWVNDIATNGDLFAGPPAGGPDSPDDNTYFIVNGSAVYVSEPSDGPTHQRFRVQVESIAESSDNDIWVTTDADPGQPSLGVYKHPITYDTSLPGPPVANAAATVPWKFPSGVVTDSDGDVIAFTNSGGVYRERLVGTSLIQTQLFPGTFTGMGYHP